MPLCYFTLPTQGKMHKCFLAHNISDSYSIFLFLVWRTHVAFLGGGFASSMLGVAFCSTRGPCSAKH